MILELYILLRQVKLIRQIYVIFFVVGHDSITHVEGSRLRHLVIEKT